MTREPQHTIEPQWLNTIGQWMRMPDRPDYDEIRQLHMQIGVSKRRDNLVPALEALLEAFAGMPNGNYVQDIVVTGQWTVGTAIYCALSVNLLTQSTDKEAIARNSKERANRWQVDAAWAILHDQPIPPLTAGE
jgi:hypothetical protein